LQFSRKKNWQKWREKETEADRERASYWGTRKTHSRKALATLRNDKHPQDARLGTAGVAKPQ
jgi:hypothetical protein